MLTKCDKVLGPGSHPLPSRERGCGSSPLLLIVSSGGLLRARRQAQPKWIEALQRGREPGPTMRHRRLRRRVAFRNSYTDYRTGVRQEQFAALVCTCFTWGRAGVVRPQEAPMGKEKGVWTLLLRRFANRTYRVPHAASLQGTAI